jgi:putative sporulation protein YyaC
MREIPSIRKPSSSALPFRVEYTDPAADQSFSMQLAQIFHRFLPSSEIVCVCIGTDRSTGDALGPLVGTLLKQKMPGSLTVYGTLDEPVHALNLEQIVQKLHQEHRRATVLAVDACLGQLKSVGQIQLGLGPIKPGAGVHKELPEVGQIHITGIVNVAGFMEYFVLQNTRLSLVMRMAEIISTSIVKAVTQTSLSLA